MTMDWQTFWDTKAAAATDFQATGRGLMDAIGYLHTVAEVVRLLNLKQNQTLADIGCGSGLLSLSLSPWLNHIYAIDISPALIQRAQSNLSGIDNISLQVGSLTQLPLEDSSVDRLLAYSVLQYLNNISAVKQAFLQVSRVLKKGGKALLAANPDPTKRYIYEEVVRSREDKQSAEKEITLLDSLLWITQEDLTRLAEEANLLAHIEPISSRIWQHFYMYDIIVEKI